MQDITLYIFFILVQNKFRTKLKIIITIIIFNLFVIIVKTQSEM